MVVLQWFSPSSGALNALFAEERHAHAPDDVNCEIVLRSSLGFVFRSPLAPRFSDESHLPFSLFSSFFACQERAFLRPQGSKSDARESIHPQSRKVGPGCCLNSGALALLPPLFIKVVVSTFRSDHVLRRQYRAHSGAGPSFPPTPPLPDVTCRWRLSRLFHHFPIFSLFSLFFPPGRRSIANSAQH